MKIFPGVSLIYIFELLQYYFFLFVFLLKNNWLNGFLNWLIKERCLNQFQVLEIMALLGIRDKYYYFFFTAIFSIPCYLNLTFDVNKMSWRGNKWYWKPDAANRLFPVELELMNYENDDI